jgi:hypothetical protein
VPSSRLLLLSPPALVQVRDLDGARRRALLVARRGDRCFLQVHRGPGDNVLRWLPAADVRAVGPRQRAGATTVRSAGNPHDVGVSDT